MGVASGVGLKGELYLFGSRVAAVDGLVDASSSRPRTAIKAEVAELKIGPLALHETNLDLLMAASAESYFRASGGCDLLGARVAAKADLDAQRTEVVMSGIVANAFQADVTCSSMVSDADWQFAAQFKNDFSSAFESKVSDDILAWARQAEQDFNKAKGLNKIKKGVQKDAMGVERDAKRIAYQAKARAYDVARAAINKVPVDADPQIVALFASQKVAQSVLDAANAALRKIHGTVPIDADPRLVPLFADRDVALAGVRTTQDAFNLAHRVPVDADPRVATLFVARDGATAGIDAARLGKCHRNGGPMGCKGNGCCCLRATSSRQ